MLRSKLVTRPSYTSHAKKESFIVNGSSEGNEDPGGEKKTTSFIPCIMAREGIAYFIGRLTRTRPALFYTFSSHDIASGSIKAGKSKVELLYKVLYFLIYRSRRNNREITLAIVMYEVPRDS